MNKRREPGSNSACQPDPSPSAMSDNRDSLLHTAFHETAALTAILAADGTVLEVSRSACEAAGFSPAEVRGCVFWRSPWWRDLPEEADRVCAHVVEAAKGRATSFDCSCRMAGGEARHSSFCLTPLRNGGGRVSHMVATGFDITERKKSADELHATHQRLRFAQKAAGSAAFEWDIRHNVNRWSREMEELYGLEAGTFANGSYEEWLDLVFPEDRALVEAAAEESLKNGTFRAEWRIFKPADGQVRWIQARGKVLYDALGNPERMIGVNTDITDQKRAATARQESEERFRFTFEEAALGLAHVGLDGRWLHINRKLCEIVGYSREELLSMTFQDITYPDDLDADLAHVRDLIEGRGQRYSMEKRYIRKDGSLVWVNLTVSLLRDLEGTPRYFISVIEEITARKQMEEVLAQSCTELETQVSLRTSALRSLSNRLMQLQDEERRRIARELHDSVGQYLTAIAINLDLLARPDALNQGELIGESRQLLNHCLTEIRTLSHLLHPPLLDETGFASAAQWYVEGFARRSRVAVELHLAALDRLPANVELVLFRVLQETLNNIHRHSGSSKAVVRLEFDGRQVVLEVRDFGHGIPPDRLARFQSSGTGVGVGLAGIRERVSELGGKMDITSDPGGTTVKVFLPTPEKSATSGRYTAAD